MSIINSCTANMETIIKAHKNKVLNIKKQNESYCNCAGRYKYTLKGGNLTFEKISTRLQL